MRSRHFSLHLGHVRKGRVLFQFAGYYPTRQAALLKVSSLRYDRPFRIDSPVR